MFRVEVQGLDAIKRRIASLPRQVRYAAAQALNDTGFQARADLAQEARRVFDRPTPFIQRSPWFNRAEPSKLAITIYPRDPGGKAVDPADVLRAEVQGGARKFKRSERAFQRIGILPPGQILQPAPWVLADAKMGDGYGNVRGSFMVRLLSYFQAFGEQGYRANMSDKRRRSIEKVKRVGGFMKVTGVQYFVSHGRGTRATRHVNRAGRLSRPDGQAQHLPAGIWQRSGTHGVDVKPVFYFNRMPAYPVRYRMGDVVQRTAQATLPAALSRRIAGALATAR